MDIFDVFLWLFVLSTVGFIGEVEAGCKWKPDSNGHVSVNQNIPEMAFWECATLKSISIGSGVKTIGTSAFYGTTSLGHVTMAPNSVRTMAESIFARSSVKTVTLSTSLTSFGTYAFAYCNQL